MTIWTMTATNLSGSAVLLPDFDDGGEPAVLYAHQAAIAPLYLNTHAVPQTKVIETPAPGQAAAVRPSAPVALLFPRRPGVLR